MRRNMQMCIRDRGHYSAGFTLDTYTHATMKMQIEAADKLGGFMAQTV